MLCQLSGRLNFRASDFNNHLIRLLFILCSINFLTNNLNAQIIETEQQPASTFEEIPSTQNDELKAFFDLYTTAQLSSNSLSVSNLPGGLDEPDASDIFLQKGASATVALNITKSVTGFTRVEISHTNFLSNSELNYFRLGALVGLNVSMARQFNAYTAISCGSERSSEKFREFYRVCGPIGGASITIGDPNNRSGIELGVRGQIALGEKTDFARYKEFGVSLLAEGGKKWRYRGRPHGSVRHYSTPQILSLNDQNRVDYRAGFEAALLYRFKNFELGLVFDPAVNWSNYPQFRNWDLRAGPVFRMRFGQ